MRFFKRSEAIPSGTPGSGSEAERKWLFQEIDTLRAEVMRMKRLNQDQDAQIRDLLQAHPMSDEQLNDIAQVRKDNNQMRDQINTLTLYLRTRWPEDFQSGRHGTRSLSEIVISYLSRMETPHAAEAR